MPRTEYSLRRGVRDRYDTAGKLRGGVTHRPTDAIENMGGSSDAALIGRSLTSARQPAVTGWSNWKHERDVSHDRIETVLGVELELDEVIAVEGTLSGDAGILFVDSMHFPDVPRSHRPNTADRDVQAALISDVHVGSQEFMADAWNRFADWLHTEEAARIEYLLIAGDMVEGVGVYPNQDEELDVIDIYEQYEAFSEHLKSVPGDLEIVMIPGNHDAVRLAEPQPGFDDELRDIMRLTTRRSR